MKPVFDKTPEELIAWWRSVMITPTHPFRKTYSLGAGKHNFNEEKIQEHCQKMIDKIEKDIKEKKPCNT